MRILQRSSIYEAKFISNLVTNSTMEAEPLTAAYKVARISSKRH